VSPSRLINLMFIALYASANISQAEEEAL
jgi:hypothetical protein